MRNGRSAAEVGRGDGGRRRGALLAGAGALVGLVVGALLGSSRNAPELGILAAAGVQRGPAAGQVERISSGMGPVAEEGQERVTQAARAGRPEAQGTRRPLDGELEGAGEAAARGAVTLSLLELLASLPQEPEFARWAAGAPEALREHLFSLLLAAGELGRAETLLGDPRQAPLVARLAGALESAARPAEAAELWRWLLDVAAADIGQSLRSGQTFLLRPSAAKPWGAWRQGLGRTDPAALLEWIETHRPLAGPGAVAGLDALRAVPLIALGRVQEASDLLARLALDPTQSHTAYSQLVSMDPARAETFLHEELALDADDPTTQVRLANLLLEQERGDELRGLLTSWAETNPLALPMVLEELGHELPLEQLEALVALPALEGRGASVLFERYADEERWEDAARAYEALVANMEGGNVPGYLALPPAALIERDPAAAFRWAQRLGRLEHANDEVWGDIGDLLLQLGDEAGAQRAWERARAIDPADGEWTSKLANLRSRRLGRGR